MNEILVRGPIKVFVWFWSRPTLRVRISADSVEEEVGGLKFEVTNDSNKTTSLNPSVKAHFLTIKRANRSVVFDVREQDRGLPPFSSKHFSASARKSQPERHHAWFRMYAFSPTKGRACRVRVRNASLEQIWFFRFWAERLWFQATGRLFGITSSMTIDEYRAQQRAKGPH